MKALLLVLALACSANAGQMSSRAGKPGAMLWHFNEGTGSNRFDSIQGANLSGVTAPWVTGRWGSGISFTRGVADGWNGAIGKTVSQGVHWIHMWVKTSQAYSNVANGWEDGNGNDVLNLWSASYDSHLGANGGGCGKLVFNIREYAGSWSSVYCGNKAVNDGRWHMVDKVRTSDNVTKLYIDGVLDLTASPGKNIPASANTTNFGFFEWADNALTFVVDEFFVASNTGGNAGMPTAGEIQRIYTESLGRH